MRKRFVGPKNPPRLVAGDNWFKAVPLRIGMVIDWIDAYPGAPNHEGWDAITWRIARYLIAPVEPEFEELSYSGHNYHPGEYSPRYHATIAAHLYPDEFPFAEQLYRRLLTVDPSCLSAFVNLAELARRAGNMVDAQLLLQRAETIASRSATAPSRDTMIRRHRTADLAWIIHIQCALARLNPTVGDGAPLLELANAAGLEDLILRLRAYEDWDKASLAVSQAFSVASEEQRLFLHVAARCAPIAPGPPAAAHATLAAAEQVERMIEARRMRER